MHGRVCSKGTSVLLRFSCTKAIAQYLFGIYAKCNYAETYEIQQVIIPHFNLSSEDKRRKNILHNILRFREMKDCLQSSLMTTINVRNTYSVSFVQGSFHQANQLRFPTTPGRQCSCIAMFAIVYSAFKAVKFCDSQDLDDILV